MFREIFASTPFFSAGGWNDTNVWGVIESGAYDALAIGRYFLSNPDLVTRHVFFFFKKKVSILTNAFNHRSRLRDGRPLVQYDRSRFYGPFDDREYHYSDYLSWDEQQEKDSEVVVEP